MFIRWIERPSKTPGHYATALSVILAETKRVNGAPRQRHIAYLGGITDGQIAHPRSRCDFWDTVTATFDRLGTSVMPSDRQRFEAAIALRVPRPSADEHEAAALERAEHEQEREEGMKEAMKMALTYRLGDVLEVLRDRCAFCGKRGTDMVKGDIGAMICNACIEAAVKGVAERKAEARKTARKDDSP